MRIVYRNTLIDVVRFQAAHQFSSFSYQAIVLATCLMMYVSFVRELTTTGRVALAVCWYVLAWALQILVTAFILATKRDIVDRAEHALEIQDEALLAETSFGRSYHFWRSPMRVVSRGHQSAVYVSSMSAHVVPHRAFASSAERRQFLALLRQKLDAGRPGGA